MEKKLAPLLQKGEGKLQLRQNEEDRGQSRKNGTISRSGFGRPRAGLVGGFKSMGAYGIYVRIFIRMSKRN